MSKLDTLGTDVLRALGVTDKGDVDVMNNKGMDFVVDTSNYFGLDHETFKDNLQAFALTKPSEYFTLRGAIIKGVKKENLKNFYALFYNLLTNGTQPNGDAYVTDNADLFKPNMSKQEVSEIALGAVKTLNQLIDRVMDDILPKEFLKIANDTTAKKTMGDLATGV
jgi:hypothetical protein